LPIECSPATVEEAAAAIRDAGREGRRVSIDREGADVVLSTRRLDRVLEHEAGDLTCTVEAGIRLSALNERLAPFGQMLALDAPGDPTVGACVAGNLSGPRRHLYGGPRDLVLGVTVVLGDGTVAHSGGKVVKNVAGYDLGKLFCGSRGRLGLIARVSLRLHPRPASAGTLVTPLLAAGEAEAKGQIVHRSTLIPAAVDVLSPDRLALLFEGTSRAVEAQLALAARLVGGEEDGGVWEEVAARQLAAKSTLSVLPWHVPPDDGVTVLRLGAGVAYSSAPAAPVPLPPLLERLRRELDPDSVLT
jgi:glycolate oxidase FAD binding subunit